MRIDIKKIKSQITVDNVVQLLILMSRRVVGLYILTAVFSFLVVDFERGAARAKAATLSRLMPSFSYLRDFEDKLIGFDRKEFEKYEHYYRNVNQLVAHNEDSYGMLGYVYYYLGKENKAIAMYKKALGFNPYYFGFNYNLGVIHFKRGRYEEAAEFLSQGVQSQIHHNLNFMTSSRILYPMIRDPENVREELRGKFRSAYRDAYTLLALSFERLENYQQMIAYAQLAISSALEYEGFFHYYSGLAAYKLGDPAQAALFLQKSIKQNPKRAKALYYLGLSFKALKQEKLAVQALQMGALLEAAEKPTNKENEIDVRVF